MATIKKASKGTMSPKSSNVSSKLGSYGKKMKSGGSLGMKSVKAGYDDNPGVTRADIIVAAKKGKAKKGMKVKKAQMGKTMPTAPSSESKYSKFIGPVDRPMQMQPSKKQSDKMKKLATPSEAKTGKMLKKQAAVAIAMKKAGKAPKKAMMGSMMKKGGKMKKCAYGCK